MDIVPRGDIVDRSDRLRIEERGRTDDVDHRSDIIADRIGIETSDDPTRDRITQGYRDEQSDTDSRHERIRHEIIKTTTTDHVPKRDNFCVHSLYTG